MSLRRKYVSGKGWVHVDYRAREVDPRDIPRKPWESEDPEEEGDEFE